MGKQNNEDWGQKVDQWNKLAREVGLATAKAFTEHRRKHYRGRTTDLGDGWWEDALIEASRLNPFALGENDRSWRLSLDYVLSPRGCPRLLEGHWRASAVQAGESGIDAVLGGE